MYLCTMDVMRKMTVEYTPGLCKHFPFAKVLQFLPLPGVESEHLTIHFCSPGKHFSADSVNFGLPFAVLQPRWVCPFVLRREVRCPMPNVYLARCCRQQPLLSPSKKVGPSDRPSLLPLMPPSYDITPWRKERWQTS